MNAESSSTIRGRTVSKKWRKVLVCTAIGLGIVVVVGGAGVYATLLFGNVRGEEFAPETFQRREFSYYQVPVLGLQVTGVDRTDATTEVEEVVASKDVLALPTPRSPDDYRMRWDLVQATRSGAARSYGEAEILCRYFDTLDSAGDHVWRKWTKDNPELALIAWRAIREVADRELYVLVPALFDRARSATDAATLEAEIRGYLADQYLRFASAQAQLGNHEHAVELYTALLEYTDGVDYAAALRGRADAYESLGETSKAAADRNAAAGDAEAPE